MKVMLTGGVGFIGLHLAQLLTRQGHEVVALDNLSPQVHREPAGARLRFPGLVVAGDVRDVTAAQLAMRGCDAVVHLAAETGVAQSMDEPDRYHDVNVRGTEVVAAEAARLRVPLVFMSSRAVYGEGAYRCETHGRVTGGRCCRSALPDASREDDAHTFVSVYGQSKSEGEQVARGLRPVDRSWAIVRPQNVVGPGQAPQNPYTGVLAAFAARLRAGKAPQVYGTGHQTRDFIDVRELTQQLGQLVMMVKSRGTAEMICVNSGTAVRTSLADLAQIAVEASLCSVAVETVDRTRPGDIEHACADITASRRLGLHDPLVPLSASVRDFLEYAWSQPAVDPGLWDEVARSSTLE
ncbi:MAG: NAD-dependent epimerase/dehydratase family protein [Actinomycetes bacterium]